MTQQSLQHREVTGRLKEHAGETVPEIVHYNNANELFVHVFCDQKPPFGTSIVNLVAMFTISHIGGENALTILSGFIDRLERDRSILADHTPRRFSYDETARMSFSGTLVRADGAEACVFAIEKPEAFVVDLVIPTDVEYYPSIRVVGSIGEAERFLLAFKMADGAWS